jgi:glyoxylase-like metal-dependent hydrolase (beta-lactamase superfamily II)
MKINDCLFILDIPTQMQNFQSPIHPTLIQDGDAVILIDTGYPGQLPVIRTQAEGAGASFDRLNTVIMTHHDLDHLGGLGELRTAYPGQFRIFSHETEVSYINGEKRPLKLSALDANFDSLPPERKDLAEKMSSAYARSFSPVDRALVDGERLPYCGGITVIHTPGHTLGHICLYVENIRTLIGGDAFRVEDGELVRCPPEINHDNQMYVNSLKKLSRLDIKAIVNYHGGLYDRGDVNRRIAQLAEE